MADERHHPWKQRDPAEIVCSVAVLDEDVACSVAVLFLNSFLLSLRKPAALINAFAAAMKDQGGLSIC